MRKLEEILDAEDAARRALADASEHAGALVRDASAAARSLVEEAQLRAREESAAVRQADLDAADAEADRTRDEAASALGAQVTRARARIDAVVGGVVRELVG